MKELSLNNCRLDKRYDIRDELGRGSYAEIFLARDVLCSPDSPHCDVVIKALNVFLQDDLDADLERTLVENFQNEALALDRVRHPNIISRLGHGTARDLKGTVFHYLVLEYLSGGNLQNLAHRKSIGFSQALDYIEQVCSGLSHAHSKGVIHRDIKPQNLLLTSDLKTIKIADFGVARFSFSHSPITRVGTNIYAPPEHSPLSAGQTGKLGFSELTPSADVYSLAKTVYVLLTGQTPRAFANRQITELPAAIQQELWADELLGILKRATADDPGIRHSSVAEFWIDMAAMRQVASSDEEATIVGAEPPRPHVSRGYTPIVPAAPQFDPVTGLEPRRATAAIRGKGPAFPHGRVNISAPAVVVEPASPRFKLRPTSRTSLRRLATLFIAVVVFTGLLYGTASYMRGRGVLPEIRNPFAVQTATANTDIYLRPSPNTENEPIGLVTKNSKVRIVKSQNNWYQVDIIQQGRERSSPPGASRGWLNGKYLELDRN